MKDTRCPICLKEFWQQECVLDHIRHGRTPCKSQVLVRGPVLSEREADEMDLALLPYFRTLHRRGLRRHALEAPCVRAHGPLVPKIHGPSLMFQGSLQPHA